MTQAVQYSTVHTKCFSTPRANEVTTSEAMGDQCMHSRLPLTKTLPSPVIIDPLWAELSHTQGEEFLG